MRACKGTRKIHAHTRLHVVGTESAFVRVKPNPFQIHDVSPVPRAHGASSSVQRRSLHSALRVAGAARDLLTTENTEINCKLRVVTSWAKQSETQAHATDRVMETRQHSGKQLFDIGKHGDEGTHVDRNWRINPFPKIYFPSAAFLGPNRS